MWIKSKQSEELYHYGVKGQKWGVRNGPPYPVTGDRKTVTNRYTSSISRKALEKEKVITKDVVQAAKSSGSEMHGLEHRLKTKDSISRKIETDSIEKNITLEQAANDIKDAVRYTTISDDDKFVSSYFGFKKNLQDKGYTEVRCKNYFELYEQGKVKHKSVQSVFRDPTGYLFEVQFQTPSSQKAKDAKVPLYEERRKPGNSDSRNKELERQMELLAEKVPTPKDIGKIHTR